MKRQTFLIIFILIIFGLAILCIVKWEIWFGQPEEDPYAVSSTPWREMLTFGDEGELSRNISWQCDSVVKDAYVELVSNSVTVVPAQGEVFQSRAGKAAYYVARLNNLRPNTYYKYKVTTGNASGEWHEFRTFGEADRDVSFLFVGDVQDTIGGEANHFLKQALEKHPSAEFLVCGGDLTERPRDVNWAETFRDLDSIRTSMPILAITGNHDYLKELPYKLERRFSLVFSYFLNSMIGENQVYSLRYGSAQFFLLDSDRELPFLLTQRDWLENELEKSTAKWKIVVIHHPLYSIKDKNNNLKQRWMFADLIEKNNVALVLQAHEHNYGRMKHANTIYTISHCSPKSYRHKNEDAFDVTHFDSRYYQYIYTHGDTLFMTVHEVYNDALVDSLAIVL